MTLLIIGLFIGGAVGLLVGCVFANKKIERLGEAMARARDACERASAQMDGDIEDGENDAGQRIARDAYSGKAGDDDSGDR